MALNEQQVAEALRIYERLRGPFDDEARRIARSMAASKPTNQLLGQTEHELRDRVHALGAEALEEAAQERQKRGSYEGASCVCPQCQVDARYVEDRGK